MGKLDEKVAIVTGAARGLGRAYAKRLAGLGAKIAAADLNLCSYEEFEAEAKDMTADSTVAEIEASSGTALGIEVDVRDREAVEAMVARVIQEWGRVDILVANAGGGRGRPIDTKASTLDPALLQLVTEMNLFGTIYSCNAVAPIMKQQRAGKIITVSSVAGTAPSADGGYAHYGAAKAAIAHYTRYLAQDLGPFGITVNCIAPGVIATGRIMATVIPGSVQSNRDRAELVALRRLGTVEDCAKVIEFLSTDLSDYVTGAVIPIVEIPTGSMSKTEMDALTVKFRPTDPAWVQSRSKLMFFGQNAPSAGVFPYVQGPRNLGDLIERALAKLGAEPRSRLERWIRLWRRIWRPATPTVNYE